MESPIVFRRVDINMASILKTFSGIISLGDLVVGGLYQLAGDGKQVVFAGRWTDRPLSAGSRAWHLSGENRAPEYLSSMWLLGGEPSHGDTKPQSFYLYSPGGKTIDPETWNWPTVGATPSGSTYRTADQTIGLTFDELKPGDAVHITLKNGDKAIARISKNNVPKLGPNDQGAYRHDVTDMQPFKAKSDPHGKSGGRLGFGQAGQWSSNDSANASFTGFSLPDGKDYVVPGITPAVKAVNITINGVQATYRDTGRKAKTRNEAFGTVMHGVMGGTWISDGGRKWAPVGVTGSVGIYGELSAGSMGNVFERITIATAAAVAVTISQVPEPTAFVEGFDMRIRAVVAHDGLQYAVVQRKDVPAGVKMSGGNGTVAATVNDVRYGLQNGSSNSDGEAFVRVLLSSLPWAKKTEQVPSVLDPRIIKVLDNDVVIIRIRDVVPGMRRSESFSTIEAGVSQHKDKWQAVDLHSGRGGLPAMYDDWYSRIHVRELTKLQPLVAAPAATGPSLLAAITPPVAAAYRHGNSGRTYSFIAGKNPIDGADGWQPTELAGDKRGPAFDAVIPIMTVHDVMEHFPGDEYAVHAEYMAQGAMLWLRYEGGFFGQVGESIAAVVPAALGMLFAQIKRNSLETKAIDLLDGHASWDKPLPTAVQFAYYEMLSEGKKIIDKTYSYSTKETMMKSLERGAPWIVRGYWRQAERYNGLDRKRLVNLYKKTVEQIKDVKAGAKLKLTMNYERYTSKVELEYSTDVTA